MAAAAGAAAATAAMHAPPPKRRPQGELFDGDTASFLPHEWAWQQHFQANGFVRTPHSFFSRLPFGFSSIEMAAVGLILQRTVGAPVTRSRPNRPEWVAITQAEIARLVDASENGVGAALGRLAKWRLIESRPVKGNKRANEYRVMLDAWTSCDVKAARKERATLAVDPGEGEEETGEPDTAGDGADAPIPPGAWGAARGWRPGKPARVSLPEGAKAVELFNETEEQLEISTATREDGTVAVRVAKRTEGEGYVKDSPSHRGNQEISAVTEFPKPLGELKTVNAANKQLTAESVKFADALDRSFARQVGSPVPRPLVAAQYQRLHSAGVSLDVFWQRARKRAAAFTEWGFLANIVDDVVAVAAIERSAMPQPAIVDEPDRPDPLAKYRRPS